MSARILAIAALCFTLSSLGYADTETFLLKNGKEVHGTVFKRTATTIWVSTDKGDVGVGKNQIVGEPDIPEAPAPSKVPTPPAPEPASDAPAVRPYFSWYDGSGGYENALNEQKGTGRPFLIYFHATWCPACRQYNNEIFPESRIAEELNHILKVRIDIDVDKDLSAQYGVKAYPTIFAVYPTGPQELSRDMQQFYAQLKDLANWVPAN